MMLVFSGFAAWFVLFLLSKIKKELDDNDVLLTFLIGICGGVAGAISLRPIMRIVEVAFSWQQFSALSFTELFQYISGEIVFYGGFLGGLAAVVLFCRKFKIKIVPMFDILAPAVAIGHAFGRIGCHLGGCCYGMQVSSNHPFAVVFPENSLVAPPGVPLLATQLLEAGFLFILGAVLVIIYLKSRKKGICATLYLLAYPAWRFILEYFRADSVRGNYWLFTTSQYISIALFIFGICYYLFMRKRPCN